MGRSRRVLLIAISTAVVAVAGMVTSQAFAGTLPGRGGGVRPVAGGLAGKGPAGKGLAGKGLAGKGLAGKGLAGKGLAGKGLGGKGLAGKGLAGKGSVLDRLRKRGATGGAQGGATGGAADGAQGGATAGAQGAGGCSDVDLVFARGTGEPPGFGIVGKPLVQALTGDLPNSSVSSFAVEYAAAANQASAGPGATNMTQHIEQVAQSCPNTQFVIGGYSQGATVTDVAMGIKGVGTAGDAIPADLQSRVKAVLAFGNPLGLRKQTIAQASPEFGAKAKEFCNTGDPVCGNGNNIAAHLAYPRNGTVEQGAQFAAQQLGG